VYVNSEFKEIEHVIKLYLEGLYERKFPLLEEAFWEEARNVGVTPDNKFWFKNMDFWEEKCSKLLDKGANDNRFFEIESVDIWHNSAVAKVKMTVSHPERFYECTDFLSFLKIDGNWKIVHKLWSGRNTPK
jgi:hypothetical protein